VEEAFALVYWGRAGTARCPAMELAVTAALADGSYDEGGHHLPTVVGIALAGGLGALMRYAVDGAVGRRFAGFPWGTFVVNVTGALLLGFVFTLFMDRVEVAPWVRSTITIGFLGGYTTFSTLSLETYRLMEDGAWGLASANALGSLAAGILAVYVGVVLGRLV
jgi:fluoride exporter